LAWLPGCGGFNFTTLTCPTVVTGKGRKLMLRSVRRFAAFPRFALLAASVLLGGCSLDTDVSDPSAMIRYQGDNQTVAPSTPLPTDLATIVVNQFGERIKNVTVNWSIVSGGGTLGATSSITDDSGIASVSYTSGTTTGTVIIQAKVTGLLPLTFTVTVA